MALPHLGGVTRVMSIRGLIFWTIASAAGLAALSSLAVAEEPVITLQSGLGAEVETTRL